MSDWKTDIDGDLVIEGGDLAIATEAEATAAEIAMRIRTELFGYAPDPTFGAGLDRFRGEPQSRETGTAIERAATQALLRDGKFPPDSITVRAVPLSVHTIGLYLFVVPQFTGAVDPIRLQFVIDLNSGDITSVTGGTR